MKRKITVLFSLIFLNIWTTGMEKVNAKSTKERISPDVRSAVVTLDTGTKTMGDLEAAGTFGIGHGHGFGWRRHYGYHHGGGLGQFLGGHGHYRPTYGKIIITYPKYIGYGHYGHGGYNGQKGYHNRGFGKSSHEYGWKKGGFYPSLYLGPIGGYTNINHYDRFRHGYFG